MMAGTLMVDGEGQAHIMYDEPLSEYLKRHEDQRDPIDMTLCHAIDVFLATPGVIGAVLEAAQRSDWTIPHDQDYNVPADVAFQYLWDTTMAAGHFTTVEDQ